MNNLEISLPPPRELHPALRRITERLAAELALPRDTAPDWSELEWRLARGVAAIHGVSSLLASALKWDGPPGWKLFLATQRSHVATRHRRIEGLLSQLDTRSRDESVALMALKGAALHNLGLYRAGERPMADVDLLLVQPRDARRAEQVLESLGFNEQFANWKHQVFVPAVQTVHTDVGEHAQNYLKIELHQRIAEILPLRITDITRNVVPSRPHPGLNAYPSNAALLMHLLIHAAGAMAYRALRLLHLHDIALVCAHMSASDWNELLAPGQDRAALWWALPPLRLTARYYNTAVPNDILAALTEHCQWTLRQVTRRQSLSDVSLSYPWIEAFPGIGWCRSLAEVLELIYSRIRPGEKTLQLRKIEVQTQVPAAHSAWASLSQGQRVWRWLLSKQTRAQTLHAVRTALTGPHV
jgi:hypothetical protein